MNNGNIGIVGNGFVGNSLSQLFMNKKVLIFDVIKIKSNCSFEELNFCDIIFICLPTPTLNGNCSISLITETINKLKKQYFNGIVVIKSTVPPGTTKSLSKIIDRLVFNPEFLREKSALEDTLNPDRILIGGKPEDTKIIKELYLEYFHQDIIFTETDPTIFELVKYTCNTFLAAKVALFNEYYNISEKIGVEYNTMKKYVLLDTRIGPSHTQVPGPDGILGYGGNCFIKDTEAFIEFYNKEKVDCPVLSAVTQYAQVHPKRYSKYENGQIRN